jgi:DNA polymerase-3 subunit chi
VTDVSFYHLTRSTLEQTLPRLLEKALQGGARCLVMVGNHARVEPLSAHLWTYDPASFLPHGTRRDGDAERQPVWLTDEDENPNEATMLFLTDGAKSNNVGKYQRCFELFDGRDENALAQARQRWKDYREAGHTVSYWQQNERGGWEKKAG